MSLSSNSSSSPKWLKAITLASQSCALIKDALELSELSIASFPLPFVKFAECLRAQPDATKILITCCELFKDTSPDSAVVRATMGALGHQFNVATVTLPDGRQTHIRADYYAEPPPGCSSRLVVACNDNHGELTKHGHLISRIAAPTTLRDRECPPDRAPTLRDLGLLLDIAHTRLGNRPYDLLGRNCFWMTDMLFYTFARRHAAYWRAGTQTPEAPLQRYLREEAGVLETAIACATPDQFARFIAGEAERERGARDTGLLHAGGGDQLDRFMMHDQEVAEWIKEWEREAPQSISMPALQSQYQRLCSYIRNFKSLKFMRSAPLDAYVFR
ncbi:hypothetical protein BC628DRAFT_1412271 [Trametes gibbosa]|nr:hypothetical protein BC628DRAFT_1412271 [Trametes gibbosa]